MDLQYIFLKQWQNLMQLHKDKLTFPINNQMPYTLKSVSHCNAPNISW